MADVKPQPLCPPCTEARLRWLDSKPSKVLPTYGFTYGSGAAYDQTVAAINQRARDRREAWAELVRTQMAGIATNCREGRHVA